MGCDIKNIIETSHIPEELDQYRGAFPVTTVNHPLCNWGSQHSKVLNHPGWNSYMISTKLNNTDRLGLVIQIQLIALIAMAKCTEELDSNKFLQMQSLFEELPVQIVIIS